MSSSVWVRRDEVSRGCSREGGVRGEANYLIVTSAEDKLGIRVLI